MRESENRDNNRRTIYIKKIKRIKVLSFLEYTKKAYAFNEIKKLLKLLMYIIIDPTSQNNNNKEI